MNNYVCHFINVRDPHVKRKSKKKKKRRKGHFFHSEQWSLMYLKIINHFNCIGGLKTIWSKVPSRRKRFVLCRYNGIFRPVNNGTNSRLEINLSNYENCEFLVRFYPRLISFFISCGLGNRCRAWSVHWTALALTMGVSTEGSLEQFFP